MREDWNFSGCVHDGDSAAVASAINPPEVSAVPSYARQTGLACRWLPLHSPEINPAGRKFKLTGYVDRGDETKTVKADGSKKRAPLDLLASLPLSVMLETSFTSLKTAQPQTQNGNLELPQDFSLFLAGAWTSKIGSFMQVTYDTQDDHFTSDNTDIRFANKTSWAARNWSTASIQYIPTVEDLWNSTRAGVSWIAEATTPPTPQREPFYQRRVGRGRSWSRRVWHVERSLHRNRGDLSTSTWGRHSETRALARASYPRRRSLMAAGVAGRTGKNQYEMERMVCTAFTSTK